MTTPTTEQPKHTAIPWIADETGRILGPDTPDEQPVIAQVYGAAVQDQEGHANAQFICTAVNAHQELVEALKGCLAFGRFIHSAESELAAQRAAALLSKLSGGAK